MHLQLMLIHFVSLYVVIFTDTCVQMVVNPQHPIHSCRKTSPDEEDEFNQTVRGRGKFNKYLN